MKNNAVHASANAAKLQGMQTFVFESKQMDLSETNYAFSTSA